MIMAARDTTTTGRRAAGKADEATDGAAEQVQAAVDAETEQGFRGYDNDPTPNENYTVEGVLAGKPTPETDPAQAAKAAAEASAARSRFTER